MLPIQDGAGFAREWVKSNCNIVRRVRLVPKFYSAAGGYRRFNVHLDLMHRGESDVYCYARLNVHDNGEIEVARDRRDYVESLLDEGTYTLADSYVPINPVPWNECRRFYGITQTLPKVHAWFHGIEPVDRRSMNGIDAYASVTLRGGRNAVLPIRISPTRASKSEFFSALRPNQAGKYIGLVIRETKKDLAIISQLFYILAYIRGYEMC